MKKNNLFTVPEKIFGISSSLIKLFLPPFGLFLFFLTSFGWLIGPKIESIKSLNQSSESTKLQMKSIDDKRNYLLSVDQAQLGQNAEYLSSAVIKEKNSYLLVGVIKDIAGKYGFSIDSFSLSIGDLKGKSSSLKVTKKEDIAEKMPLDVELSGSSDKFIDLVKGLENNLPILYIDNLETNQKGNNISIKMSISSYYLPESVDIVSENLTINDLKLTKEESDLLAKIRQFEKGLSLEGVSDFEGGAFTEYQRADPFSL
jgi:hypothetical protein